MTPSSIKTTKNVKFYSEKNGILFRITTFRRGVYSWYCVGNTIELCSSLSLIFRPHIRVNNGVHPMFSTLDLNYSFMYNMAMNEYGNIPTLKIIKVMNSYAVDSSI